MVESGIYRFEDRCVLRTPYNRRLVEGLKAEIPYTHREWDPEDKTWTVWEPHCDVAVEITTDCYPSIVIRSSEMERHDQSIKDEDRSMLFVSADAPRVVIDAAYRALAKHLHPDVNGPTGADRMRAINSAYERLKKRVA